MGLEAASIADYKPYDVLTVCISYPFVSMIERLVPDYNIRIAQRDFADTVTFTLEIPQESTNKVKDLITNTTNGTAIYSEQGNKTIPIIRSHT